MADIQTQHWLLDDADDIRYARQEVNDYGGGGAIGILAGDYNLKSTYYEDLEDDPETAPIPAGGDREATYAFNIESPNFTVYAVMPGATRIYGNASSIDNPQNNSTFRGGMFFLSTDADRATIWGLDIDGAVAYQETFNPNNICDIYDHGVGCWDLSHKAIYTKSPDLRILDCKLHNWVAEMVFGGGQSGGPYRMELAYCEIYDNQVSATSGTWQLFCHHNEIYELYGQVMEGLHQDTCRYYDNHLHDVEGGGFNVLGGVTALLPANGWWVNIAGNVCEVMSSGAFGAVYLAKQTTPDVSSPTNVGIADNVFRDCRTVLSASLGTVKQTFFERNLIVAESLATCDGIVSKSSSFDYCLFAGNTFWPAQAFLDAAGSIVPGNLSTGQQLGSRFINNYYRNCVPPTDLTVGGAPATRLYYADELYESLLSASLPQKATSGTPEDVPIPTNSSSEPISSGVSSYKFNTAMHLRMVTEDDESDPAYVHGTEHRLIGNPSISLGTIAYILDGRGVQLKDGFPAFFADDEDYLLLRYDANLKLWIEVERWAPRAKSLVKLSHRGVAADRPVFSSLTALTVDSVNVLDKALWGWRYFETDTGLLKVYTASGWQTYWTAA